jgi:hypothetical protein
MRTRLYREGRVYSTDNGDAQDRIAFLLKVTEELSTRIERTQYDGIFCTRGPDRRFLTAQKVIKEFDDGKDHSAMYEYFPLRPIWSRTPNLHV